VRLRAAEDVERFVVEPVIERRQTRCESRIVR
jgi:hypothetical protein